MSSQRQLLISLVVLLPGRAMAGDAEHWAFRTPARPPLPAVKRIDWPRTPIDRFVLAELESAGLTPSAEADKRTLLRRVSFDLTGLPPTPGETAAFLTDTSPDAYEKLVDHLLASPHFGERWAQHWLDVVRFAETNGYELDADRPHAWRYRDYVVAAFNADLPYDRFLLEQLAGDLLAAEKPPAEAGQLLVATGMHRCGPVHIVSGNLDAATLRQEFLTEVVNGLGAAVMGLTIGCARCHDHKFDPLPQSDYYRLQAYFASAFPRDLGIAPKGAKAAYQKAIEAVGARTAPLKKQVAAIEAPVKARLTSEKRSALPADARAALDTPADKRTPEQKKLVKDVQPLLSVSWDEILAALPDPDRTRRAAIRGEIAAIERTLPTPPAEAWALQQETGDPKTYVWKRGEVGKKGKEVSPGVPGVLGGVPPKTRPELAAWLARPDHPLTGRVMVNRLWQHYFGRGIVATANDFGTKGTPPTHPELLDWLAAELAAPGAGRPWALKRMHRMIVLSAAYRQSSAGLSQPKDAENKLLARQNRRRLEAEAIRDAVLTTSGDLNRTVGGPPVRVPLEPEVYDLIFTEGEPDNLWPVSPDPLDHARRSLYLFAKRNVRQPLLEAFDQPDSLTPCAARGVSTFAPQALVLMNGPFARDQAGKLAARLTWEEPTVAGQVRALYERAYGRTPRVEETAAATAFLAEQTAYLNDRIQGRRQVALPAGLPAAADPAAAAALADLCLAAFNANEFVYVP